MCSIILVNKDDDKAQISKQLRCAVLYS